MTPRRNPLKDPGSRSEPPRWSREQIRNARKASLVPLLQARGIELVELEAGNFQVAAFPGLLVKDSYWRWPERDMAGNTIDFFVKILRTSFNDAMGSITGKA